MSDWTGVYSTTRSIKAGLDLEMPYVVIFTLSQTSADELLSFSGPSFVRSTGVVQQALKAGKLTSEDIDHRARKVLEFALIECIVSLTKSISF